MSVALQRVGVRVRSGAWLQAFIVFEIACQLALLFSVFGPVRVFIRIAAFAVSLAFLLLMPIRRQSQPAGRTACWILAIVGLSLFHPNTNGLLSGMAQFALYLAILAPLFWVPQLQIDLKWLRRALLIIWAFQSLSAAVGVLQVYYPGKFQARLSPIIAGSRAIEGLKIKTATGERMFRPMGLTDVPGGASSSGFYAVLFGLGFLLNARGAISKTLFGTSMIFGMMSLYLSQMRVWLVMLLLCLLAFACVLAWLGERAKLTALLSVVPIIAVISFGWAISIGGRSMSSRLQTLVRDQPGKVYYKNRGRFLEHTVTKLLPEYPLGAGLGRWGMVYSYFGNKSNPHGGPIWAEIQWTGWLLDGGVPLIAAYVIALGLAFRAALGIAFTRELGELSIWGALLVTYNVGALAITFSYPFFLSQNGMDFWMLNAALFTAAQTARADRKRVSQPPSAEALPWEPARLAPALRYGS